MTQIRAEKKRAVLKAMLAKIRSANSLSLNRKYDEANCKLKPQTMSKVTTLCMEEQLLNTSSALNMFTVIDRDKDLDTSDASIVQAITILKRCHQACDGQNGTTTISKSQVEQLLDGFSKAFDSSSTSMDATGVEEELKKIFVSHANVFDQEVQNFIIQNFIQESHCAKTFKAALRRNTLVRRCLQAMLPIESALKRQLCTPSDVLVSQHLMEVCPEIIDPVIANTIQAHLAHLSSWDFDVFEVSKLAPGNALAIVADAVLDKYDTAHHFRCNRGVIQEFIRNVQQKYHNHPYHNAEHAADVTQSLHHFFVVGGVGNNLTPRKRISAIIAAVAHDVGHTSFSNNFHIASNDDLAIQYIYRSPLEHMHCAITFQMMKNPQCDILRSLTKLEQLEVRNLITDMILATDNTVHSFYLGRLEGLVRRAPNDSRATTEPDDEKLILQMALHAADVSNPAKPMPYYSAWAERIMQEFYLQGDRERELGLAVSVGYDRQNPIAVEKMQAGFIIGIVRPLFTLLCQFPNVHLSHCMKQLDENLLQWQSQISSGYSVSHSR